MKLKGIAWAGTKTDNYQQTVAFFRDVLNVRFRLASDDVTIFQFPNGDTLEVIGPNLAPELGKLRGPKVDFLVDSVDEAVKELESKGCQIIGQVYREEVQNWANFYAPDGNVYGVTDMFAHPLRQTKKILFYGPHQDNSYLSNWAPASLYMKGKIWPTSEHYYQAQKMAGTTYEEICRRLPSPREAFEMTRRPDVPIRADWDQVKVGVMQEALAAKFSQNPELKEQLLCTGDAEIIENSPVDYFWGIGADGSGKNRLGMLLMQLREKLQGEN